MYDLVGGNDYINGKFIDVKECKKERCRDMREIRTQKREMLRDEGDDGRREKKRVRY